MTKHRREEVPGKGTQQRRNAADPLRKPARRAVTGRDRHIVMLHQRGKTADVVAVFVGDEHAADIRKVERQLAQSGFDAGGGNARVNEKWEAPQDTSTCCPRSRWRGYVSWSKQSTSQVQNKGTAFAAAAADGVVSLCNSQR